MDAERLDLVRSLFAAMTEQAEELHESSMNGQALHPPGASYKVIAERLSKTSRNICTLAEAAAILCDTGEADTDRGSARML